LTHSQSREREASDAHLQEKAFHSSSHKAFAEGIYIFLQDNHVPLEGVSVFQKDLQSSFKVLLDHQEGQDAMVFVIEEVYEVNFVGFSYGFRPGRNQHDALDALHVGLMSKKVNWVLDLDIKKIFDRVDHEWLIRFLQYRIKDKRIIRIIKQWLKVGYLDEKGRRIKSAVGTTQGLVISPSYGYKLN
jgi:hypothetical protein